MAARTIALLAGLALAAAASAQPRPLDTRDLPLKMALSNLYVEGALDTAGHVCSRRFPEQAARWTESLTAWKTRHAALLAEVKDLDAQLSAAVKATPEALGLTREELLALRTQSVVWLLGALAEVQDPRAREICDGQRARADNEDAQTQALIRQALEAGDELLKRPRGAR